MFFPLMVIFGAFFTINLILAQILDSFNYQQTVYTKNEEIKKEKDRVIAVIEAK